MTTCGFGTLTGRQCWCRTTSKQPDKTVVRINASGKTRVQVESGQGRTTLVALSNYPHNYKPFKFCVSV